MGRASKGRAARRAATAIAKKKAGKKTSSSMKKKSKFPGDVNHDGKITGKDFTIARARGMIK